MDTCEVCGRDSASVRWVEFVKASGGEFKLKLCGWCKQQLTSKEVA